jgi:hypothetical protein
VEKDASYSSLVVFFFFTLYEIIAMGYTHHMEAYYIIQFLDFVSGGMVRYSMCGLRMSKGSLSRLRLGFGNLLRKIHQR